VEYFESHRTAAGETWDELLARHTPYMNDVGMPRPEHEVVTLRNTPGWNLRVAIWRSRQPGGPLPVVVHVHGGAWAAGNHLSFPGIATMLTNAGYLVVSIDYRRAPRHPFPAAFDDCAFVVSWCAANIREHGGDPRRMAVLGESAGANLAAAVVATGADHVRCAVLLYGLYEFETAALVMSRLGLPTSYVPAAIVPQLRNDARLNPLVAVGELPPTLVLVGERDWALDQSRALRDGLQREGVEHDYAELPGTPHGFTLLPGHPGFEEGWPRILRFLEQRQGHRAN
jgi:acetyl esterase